MFYCEWIGFGLDCAYCKQACRGWMIPVNNVKDDKTEVELRKKTFKMHFIRRLCLRFMLMPALILLFWCIFLFFIVLSYFRLYKKIKLFSRSPMYWGEHTENKENSHSVTLKQRSCVCVCVCLKNKDKVKDELWIMTQSIEQKPEQHRCKENFCLVRKDLSVFALKIYCIMLKNISYVLRNIYFNISAAYSYISKIYIAI